MLLSTKAMGQGVQLTGADTVIFYDHHDNPQNDNQAEGRAYRITQKNPVLVLRLVTQKSKEVRSV
jgi:SNF2 family DNA or RNA helicase